MYGVACLIVSCSYCIWRHGYDTVRMIQGTCSTLHEPVRSLTWDPPEWSRYVQRGGRGERYDPRPVFTVSQRWHGGPTTPAANTSLCTLASPPDVLHASANLRTLSRSARSHGTCEMESGVRLLLSLGVISSWFYLVGNGEGKQQR
eukprot:5957836-Pyramimonas_sp.AAC.1